MTLSLLFIIVPASKYESKVDRALGKSVGAGCQWKKSTQGRKLIAKKGYLGPQGKGPRLGRKT